MGDSKSLYSKVSRFYIDNTILESEIDQQRYLHSKEREKKYNDVWCSQKVNLNEIVAHFCPECKRYTDGVKYVFEGERYAVKTDMASGYLRIYDKKLKRFVKLNHEVGNRDETHFKILRREEM
ncbi:MAG: hypothetical protein IJC45_08090 [Clostridia bacterium]|nr:hypothetical protein [Clostridia bacterium]